MEEEIVVNESELTTPATTEVSVQEETVQPSPAGSKTDPNLLLKSLKEEREKRRELEEKLNSFTTSTTSSDEEVFSDEGKLLDRKIKELESKLTQVHQESARKDLLISYPILKDKMSEFDEFRDDPENKGMNLRTAAKAFMVEKGLFEPVRKGLEKPTGGDKAALPSGTMTVEEVKTLRETNYKKYTDMLQKGLIKIA